MDNMKFVIIISAIFIAFVILTAQPLFALSPEEIQVVKISPKDERAVIKTHENDLQVIKVGDSLGHYGRVIEITKGRIVIEARSDRGSEIVIIRIENGRQRIERIRKAGDERPVLYTPQSTKNMK